MTGKNFEVVENIMCSSQLIKNISNNLEMAADIAATILFDARQRKQVA